MFPALRSEIFFFFFAESGTRCLSPFSWPPQYCQPLWCPRRDVRLVGWWGTIGLVVAQQTALLCTHLLLA